MRRIAALAALLILLLLVHPAVAQDGSDSCPAPKVLVSVEISDAALAELRNESGEEISKNLAEKDFSIFIQELIASSSPSVIVRSSGEREEMLDDQIGRIEAGEQDQDASDRLVSEYLAALFALDPQAWAEEADLTEEYFAQFGDKLPERLTSQLGKLRERIAQA